MKKISFLIVILTFLVFAFPSFAQENVSLDLIDNYVLALQDRDRVEVDNAYFELKKNPETLAFMQQNYPEHYHAFSLWDLAVRFRNLRDGVEDRFDDAAASISSPPRVVESNSSSSRRSNNDIVADSPNQDRISNQNIVQTNSNQERMNQSRPTNSSIVNRNPNQDRQPNRVRP